MKWGDGLGMSGGKFEDEVRLKITKFERGSRDLDVEGATPCIRPVRHLHHRIRTPLIFSALITEGAGLSMRSLFGMARVGVHRAACI